MLATGTGKEWLSDPATFKNVAKNVEKIEVIETHLSTVSLCGDLVFKIKKCVNHGPPFTDQTSLTERERLCREEIKKNKRTYKTLI
jgi:aminoglycoside phosphotransferase family enzyme